ncbi:unnamed protein product [Laminaria digitata]
MSFSNDSDDKKSGASRMIPLLPLRDIIVFPNMVVPLFVGRPKSINALKEAMGAGKEIVLCAQRKAKTNDPAPEDIFEVGTLGTIRQLIQLPDGTVKVLVMGVRRVRIERFLDNERYFQVVAVDANPEDVEEPTDASELEELLAKLRATFETYVKLNRRIPPEMLNQISKIEEASRLADTIVAQLALKLVDKQKILETLDPKTRLELLLDLMQEEIEILQVEKKIRSRVKKQMEKTQKDLYLNDIQQMPKGGGDSEDGGFKNEIEEIEERISKKELSAEAKERLEREVKKLKMMSPMSAEATVVRNYIDWVLSLPWEDRTEDEVDLKRAEDVLDADHYGLERPKDRILEYLAVRSLTETPRGPILCFVGPPGVGKTSLGRSIATSLGREFVRLSLGGVRDEAEIRGHRRTYIGAMPGKIIQSMRKAGSANPVFLLDEIDKMSMDFRGDPSSALLEVLDPEQNATFNDHYLDLDYDLSEVMFLCTANDLRGIPGPLKDRMEIIQLPGYTEHEKLQIARHYLVPKQIEGNGLEGIEVAFTDAALRRLVDGYTREAGVRNLEREVGGVCRKIARRIVRDKETKRSFKVRAKDVSRYLGPERFGHARREERDEVGLTNGLAWTQFGGVMLVSEVSVMAGTGKLIITGKLGDVMQESARAAMSYVRARALNLGLSPDFHQKVDMHIHFPEGGQPKDGPSAGITMVTSIVSALTQIPVRHDVAMTGEITLRGRVLPIGGLKEKLLAAHRNNIKRVVIPKDNAKDLRDVPAPVRKAIEILPVAHMDDVLKYALRLEEPEAFVERLAQPLLPPEVLHTPKKTEEVTEVAIETPSIHAPH